MRTRIDPEFFKTIPKRSGVYFMFDSAGALLYIGKAKNLRARLNTHKRSEMIKLVSEIRWEVHSSEKAALNRESELLHALRPPLNIAGAWAEDYLFIGIQVQPIEASKNVKLHFQLTGTREKLNNYFVFGCFQHRRKIKFGYTALLRLLYAANFKKERFAYPSKITRDAPPYLYSTDFPCEWISPLKEFLTGRSLKLLRIVLATLLANEYIPRFMNRSLQRDIETVREFYKRGPRSTYLLKRLNKIGRHELTHSTMDSCIAKSVESLTKL